MIPYNYEHINGSLRNDRKFAYLNKLSKFSVKIIQYIQISLIKRFM